MLLLPGDFILRFCHALRYNTSERLRYRALDRSSLGLPSTNSCTRKVTGKNTPAAPGRARLAQHPQLFPYVSLMDVRRLVQALLHRLPPIYVGTVLWLITDRFAVAIGGVALSALVLIAWPFLQPLFAVLTAEILAQRREAQAHKHAQQLAASLQFLRAYQAVLTKYPPALLTASASAIAAQLETVATLLRQGKARLRLHDDDPFTPQEEAYALVEGTHLTIKDVQQWPPEQLPSALHACLHTLAQSPQPALRDAVQRFIVPQDSQPWRAALAAAERLLDQEAEHTIRFWRCVQQAHADPAIRQQLRTLLGLDAVHRQAGLQTYLVAQPLRCTPQEVATVLAYIRYESVAAKVSALLDAPPAVS